jgi:hypothetical protein
MLQLMLEKFHDGPLGETVKGAAPSCARIDPKSNIETSASTTPLQSRGCGWPRRQLCEDSISWVWRLERGARLLGGRVHDASGLPFHKIRSVVIQGAQAAKRDQGTPYEVATADKLSTAMYNGDRRGYGWRERSYPDGGRDPQEENRRCSF